MKIRKMLILSMTCLASSTLMCVSHVYADTNANINVGESVGMVSNGNQGTESSGQVTKIQLLVAAVLIIPHRQS